MIQHIQRVILNKILALEIIHSKSSFCINFSVLKGLEWFRAGYVRPNVKFYSVDNLTKNAFYYFRVAAENNIGLSEPLTSEQALHARPTFSKFIFLFFF